MREELWACAGIAGGMPSSRSNLRGFSMLVQRVTQRKHVNPAPSLPQLHEH
eukprot:CAMPEP_0202905712 /NCGR_PEP_ID=MMETSP1392-20130828/35660_1 /ASSEMBLY_ACC=CAM_ASM_000868 /TAXON_ID=225041 /ORGANISM="Chlamydomonas chlamydogama, Strain SAG 11-48b" /LENGTH=50 /DNA_ID=CAMNT_0049593929 /DNA_START=99 /DNA_END=251 /DNA_ORIENTATION=+